MEITADAVEKLKETGFNPIFLSSKRYNLRQPSSNQQPLKKVREIVKFASKADGIYRKRLASLHKAYVNHEEFCSKVDLRPG